MTDYKTIQDIKKFLEVNKEFYEWYIQHLKSLIDSNTQTNKKY
jgi:hypothetical protein